MAQLYVNLKNLREEKGLTQTGFANLIGSKQQTVASWESGTSKPDVLMLKEIAKFYNVSTDWLLGLSEYRTNEVYKEKLQQENTGIPEKITYGYLLNLIFKLKDMDYIEEFTGFNGDDVNVPHKLVMRDPFMICLLNLINSKLGYSKDKEYPILMKEIKENFADKEVLQENYQQMQDYYFNDVLLKSNGNLNLNLEPFFEKLAEISKEK